MPLLGWLLGISFARYIEQVDHWIAFGILLIIGVNFIRESRKEVDVKVENSLKMGALLLAALATSIDACAVGLSLSMSGKTILVPALIFGIVTFACSLTCYRIGAKLGEKFGPKLMCVGGIILIGIGCKILVEHLFF
jgi:putative Mn2+ efflux pump MntP